MAKRNLEKTTPTKITLNTKQGDFTLEGDVNVQSFGQMYDDWATALKGTKGNIFAVNNSIDLYTMYLAQGLVGRIHGNPSPASDGGGNKINAIIEKIVNIHEITEVEIEQLESVKTLMDEYSNPEHEDNPRNILFTDITIDSKTGKHLDEDEVFGHYRTKEYEIKREYKIKSAQLNNSKVWPPAPAAPEHWYSDSKGEAKPPFWQVLYGVGGEVQIVSGVKSLHEIVKIGLEELRKPKDGSKDNPIKLGKRGQKGWAARALQIDDIRRIIEAYIKPEMANKNGAFKHDEVRKIILNKPMKIPRRKAFQGEIRNTLGIPEEYTLKTAYFSISRGILNQMAKIKMKERGLTYKNPKGRKDNTLIIATKNGTSLDEQQEGDNTQVQMSMEREVTTWQDILKREMIC